MIVLIIGVTYAAFTYSRLGETENIITTGTITMTYTESDNGITINNAMPMTEEVGKNLSNEDQVFDFTVSINIVGNTTISYEVTADKDLTSTLSNDEVRLYLQKSTDRTNYSNEVLNPTKYTPTDQKDEFGAEAGEMILDRGSVNTTTTYYYRLRMWVDTSYELSNTSKKFTVKVNVYGKDGTTSPINKSNPNIVSAYTYNETSCVSGEEASCVATDCYQNKNSDSCKEGTIINYKVNDTETIPFHVMYDEGNTMRLQSQRNIVDKTAWISMEDYETAGGSPTYSRPADIDKGPLTALTNIETKTNSWKNVNDQTYEMGTTTFKNNAYTGCGGRGLENNICTTNTYTLPKRTAKARMITFQEMIDLGCIRGSCPIWMTNYLKNSTENNGTVNDENAYGYLLMSTPAEINTSSDILFEFSIFPHNHIMRTIPL